MIKLTKPSTKYKATYLNAEREFQKEGRHKELKLDDLRKNFPAFIQKFKNDERKNILKGFVPMTTYWLMDGKEFIGRLSIRHRLNKNLKKVGGHIGYAIRPSEREKGYGTKILKLGLLKAKKMGFKKVFMTCDDDNVGSWKIIEANGGILKERVKYKGKLIRHYWLEVK